MREFLYTLRWYLNNWNSDSRATLLRLIAKLLGETQAAERPPVIAEKKESNARLLYCPLAKTDYTKSRTRGKYPRGCPEGAIVHWTAGHPDQSLEDAMAYQAKQGYTYFCIDEAGNIGQNFPLDRWGYHAGKSYWDGFGNYVSNRIVGIEVLCPGSLDTMRRPWFNKGGSGYAKEKVRSSKGNQNIAAGTYYKYTDAQEESLKSLLLWLNDNFKEFKLSNVLGHDEVSPRRKVDPGASLSMPMPAYRKHLEKLAGR